MTWRHTTLNGTTHFWELIAPQQEPAWDRGRQDRSTTSRWKHYKTALEWTEDICRLGREVGPIPEVVNRGIEGEEPARQWYLASTHTKGRSAGLCVPDPMDPQWAWVPTHLRWVLLHLGGSPDYLTSTGGVVEIKCPKHMYSKYMSTDWGVKDIKIT